MPSDPTEDVLRKGIRVNGYTFVRRVVPSDAPTDAATERKKGKEEGDAGRYRLTSSVTHESFIVRRNSTGLLCFARVYPLLCLEENEQLRASVERHVAVTRHIRHPNVLQTVDVFASDTDLYVVEEYCEGGELFELVYSSSNSIGSGGNRNGSDGSHGAAKGASDDRPRPQQLTEDGDVCVTALSKGGGMGHLNEQQVRRLFTELMDALFHLHRVMGVCHRDLKLETVLLDREGHVKLGGFGLSAVLDRAESSTNKVSESNRRYHCSHQPTTCPSDNPERGEGVKRQETGRQQKTRGRFAPLSVYCGSVHYASPEVVQRIPYNGEKADMWSAGIILFALLTGALPFDSLEVDGDDNGEGGRGSGAEATQSILDAICMADENLLRNPLMRRLKRVMPNGYDIVHRLLRVNPEERLGHDELRQHPWITSSSSS